MGLSIEERMILLEEVGEEIIDLDELKEMLKWKVENNEEISAYDGFEPSGNIHIAQGLLRAINVNKLTKAGIKFKFLIADWHAAANQKFGGNLEFKFYSDLEKAFVDGLHPLDLKNATAKYINQILEPISEFFNKHPTNFEKLKKNGIIN